MVRKKLNMQYISNDASRKSTFKKRREGLLKKAHELTRLCDVEGCLILYGENETTPEVWPSISEAEHTLKIFKSKLEIQKSKTMLNQEAFTKNQIRKLVDQVRRMDKDNTDIEMQTLMNDCLMGRKSLDDVDCPKELTCVGWLVEMKLHDVYLSKAKAEMKSKMMENVLEES